MQRLDTPAPPLQPLGHVQLLLPDNIQRLPIQAQNTLYDFHSGLDLALAVASYKNVDGLVVVWLGGLALFLRPAPPHQYFAPGFHLQAFLVGARGTDYQPGVVEVVAGGEIDLSFDFCVVEEEVEDAGDVPVVIVGGGFALENWKRLVGVVV